MTSASLPPGNGALGTGLYDSQNEHDACGVGFVADLTGQRRHDTVASALTVLRNLDHRGAKGADPDSGDGAGIVTQMPDELLRSRCEFDLPPAGFYAAGLAFLPPAPARLSRRPVSRGSPRLRAWPYSAGARCRTTGPAAGPRRGQCSRS